ncbi:hypothetical protein [Curtobacterium herbarum]|uniref:Uncharacterized protein n=1 Tax=Curtobacterium herbarum TaxID=150122 RepID=A0ABP4K6R7_9MICO|nr:hypothetical protein [Curtobacterium herbarum]MBM7474653.1 hypothetical protein [Curtobacterium herbarum]MCS6545306.1 hypothetical protein [Curtobacterium herbarum]
MDVIGSHLVPFLALVLLGAVGLCGVIAWQLTAPLRRPYRDDVGGVGSTVPEDVDTE